MDLKKIILFLNEIFSFANLVFKINSFKFYQMFPSFELKYLYFRIIFFKFSFLSKFTDFFFLFWTIFNSNPSSEKCLICLNSPSFFILFPHIQYIYLILTSTEDQQALEDEGIVMPMKPSIPMSIPNRSQTHGQLPNVASVTNFAASNPMVSYNQSMVPYTQNYFGNQAIATPGFIANNFPSSTNPSVGEPPNRRKSIIENINPFINEQKVLPTAADLLSAFPVSGRGERRIFAKQIFWKFFPQQFSLGQYF